MINSFYKKLIENIPIAYIYCKIIFNENDTACDFEFLEINTAFEELIGFKKKDVIGKRVTNLLPIMKNLGADLIHAFEYTAINGGEKEFDIHFESAQRWFKINVYSPEKFYIVSYLTDITKEMMQLSEMERLIEISEELLQSNEQIMSYEKISEDFLVVSGAKYAAFNLFEEDGKSFTTKAITGDKGIVKKISDILGFSIEDKKWEYNSELSDKLNNRIITRFACLRDLVGSAMPAVLVALVEKTLNIGEVVVIKICYKGSILGNFTFLMGKGKIFDKDTLAEVYTRQLGLLITRRRAEDHLLKERKFTDAILQSAPGMIYLYDDQNRLVRWNKRHEDISGYSSEELLGMNLLDWYKNDENSLEAVMIGIERAAIEGVGDAEAELQTKDGKKIPMHFTASAFYMEGRQYFAGLGIDITERKKRESEILKLSYYDQLTGLYNRRFYEEELKRLDNARNLPLTIVMGDVNGLKLVNDSFGHVIGDALIRKVADILTKGCRLNDIVARLAGDEFVILLPKTDSFEAEQIIKRITDLAIKEKVGSIDISVSFGYGTKINMEENLEEIFKIAEDNMYEKKLFESQSMRGKTIKAIINTLHEKNKNEEYHSNRVSIFCEKLGQALRLSNSEINDLRSVGLLHDIGKIVIDEKILKKPGKLDDDEWKEVRRHPEVGYRMINTVNDMSTIAGYILHHHERWDGGGYPKGLRGDDIPLISRIITIADAYVAMTCERSYKAAMGTQAAIKELKDNAGTQFDPELVNIFINKVLNN